MLLMDIGYRVVEDERLQTDYQGSYSDVSMIFIESKPSPSTFSCTEDY